MTVFLMLFGGFLMPLQLIFANFFHRFLKKEKWAKYSFSLGLITTGILFLPISHLIGGFPGILAASTGITIIISALLSLPLIRLYFEVANN